MTTTATTRSEGKNSAAAGSIHSRRMAPRRVDQSTATLHERTRELSASLHSQSPRAQALSFTFSQTSLCRSALVRQMSVVDAVTPATSESAQPACSDSGNSNSNADHAPNPCSDASLTRSSAAWWSEAARSLPAVSQSCLRLAALRAEETARTDLPPGQAPLVSDPFAAALAGNRRPERAHHVFRQANRQRVREAALKASAAGAAEGAASLPSAAVAADSTNAAAESSPAAPDAAVTATATFSLAPSHAALRAELQSQASQQNHDRDQAPDTMIRTRFIDEAIAELCAPTTPAGMAQQPLQQLVLLGAGLDSRAQRLACLSETLVFELDVAPVLRYKAAVFAALGADECRVRRVEVDFSVPGGAPGVSKTSRRAKRAKHGHGPGDSAGGSASASAAAADANADAAVDAQQQPAWLTSLQAAGFDPARRTLWVAEGLLMYLGVRQVANLIGWAAAATRVPPSASSAPAAAPAAATTVAATGALAAQPSCPSSSTAAGAPGATRVDPPLHYFVADVVNEEMARSQLKWFRFFRWGCSRVPPNAPPPTAAAAAEGSGAVAAAASPIENFMRANGWQISPRNDGISYGATVADAPAPTSDSASSSAPAPPSLPPPPAHLHIHPIGRAGLSYGRYTHPPSVDSTSHPCRPPMLLETYMIRAHVACS